MGQAGDITIQIASLYYFFLKGKEIKSSITFKFGSVSRGDFDENKNEHSPPFSAAMGVDL